MWFIIFNLHSNKSSDSMVFSFNAEQKNKCKYLLHRSDHVLMSFRDGLCVERDLCHALHAYLSFDMCPSNSFYSLIILDNAHWMTKQRLHFTFRSELSCYSWQHFNVFYHKNSKQIMQIYKRKRKWKVNWSASSTEIWGTVILDISILRSLTDWVKKIRSNLRQLSTTNWDIFKLPYISPRL